MSLRKANSESECDRQGGSELMESTLILNKMAEGNFNKPPATPLETVIRMIRAADAKEVGVGNPAEETYCHPNQRPFQKLRKY